VAAAVHLRRPVIRDRPSSRTSWLDTRRPIKDKSPISAETAALAWWFTSRPGSVDGVIHAHARPRWTGRGASLHERRLLIVRKIHPPFW